MNQNSRIATSVDASKPLKDYLLGVLRLDFPYTNGELLTLARSQGYKVKLADIRVAVKDIAADVTAGRIQRDARE